MKNACIFACTAGLFLGVSVVAQNPVTVELNPSKDNTLYQTSSGNLSNGAGDAFFAGRTGPNAGSRIHRGVLAFDLSQIPAGSTVTAVSLRLRMSRTNQNTVQNVSLHRLNRDWGEGTSNASGEEGSGAPATTGDATWLHNFFNTSLWTTPGGDFQAAASATTPVGAIGDYTWQSQGMINDVQGWVNDPASNFGWIVIGNEAVDHTAKRFNSREASAARPVLSVTYTPPAQAEPGVLELTQAQVDVTESAGVVQIGVQRTGGTDGEVSAAFATVNVTAEAGQDHVAAAGRVSFADGEGGTKFIQIQILDEPGQDRRFEGVESFQVVLSDPAGGATLGAVTTAEVRIDDEEDLSLSLHFPQFGNGQGFISQIFLFNLDEARTARARIVGRTSQGAPFVLGGQPLNQVVEVAPGGIEVLETSGTGALQVGSVVVTSDTPLNGVVVFGGAFGLAGVQAGPEFSQGFVGPVDTRLAQNIRTGVAIQNLEPDAAVYPAQLVDGNGQVVAETAIEVVGLGQAALFVDEMDWDQEVDLTSFQGTLRVQGQGLSAVMIQNRLVGGVSQFATVPVAGQ
ncbi:MAG: hypothetical protein Kow001_14120 [Acidobacteriota bacterium]